MTNSRSTKEVVVISFFWMTTALMIFFALTRTTGSHVAENQDGQNTMYVEQGQSLDVESKIVTYQSILQKNPDSIKALVGLGDLYFDNRRYQEAIPIFLKAAEVDSANVHVENDLGLLYLNTGDSDNALTRFQKALAIDPTHIDSLYYIGVIHQHKGEIAKARETFEQVLASNPPPQLAQKVNQELLKIKNRNNVQ
ncbi:MAG: tetratricopeptide repeat protein [Desulfobulbaceae bacterium]|nr:tetratricopeptide repeat protein [Desulfobulbaceae bacterium]